MGPLDHSSAKVVWRDDIDQLSPFPTLLISYSVLPPLASPAKSDNSGESELLGGTCSHVGHVVLEMAGSWGVSKRRRKAMHVPVTVEGLAEPAPGTMGSLSWGKDPRKDCGIWGQKIKQNALYT